MHVTRACMALIQTLSVMATAEPLSAAASRASSIGLGLGYCDAMPLRQWWGGGDGKDMGQCWMMASRH